MKPIKAWAVIGLPDGNQFRKPYFDNVFISAGSFNMACYAIFMNRNDARKWADENTEVIPVSINPTRKE